MALQKYALEPRNYAALMRFAKENGFDVVYRETTSEEVINKIRKAFPHLTEVEVDMSLPQPEDRANASGKSKDPYHHSNDPVVVVTIPSDDSNGGKHDLPITVGETRILVQRDTPVPMPYRFYEVLKNARETRFSQSYDAANMRYTERSHEVQAINFTVNEMPAKDEITAWLHRTSDFDDKGRHAA